MSLLERIERDVKQTASDGESDEATWRRCFNKLSVKWLSREGDTGDLPRTWKSVLTALKESGFGQLTSNIEERLCGEHASGSDKGLKGMAYKVVFHFVAVELDTFNLLSNLLINSVYVRIYIGLILNIFICMYVHIYVCVIQVENSLYM